MSSCIPHEMKLQISLSLQPQDSLPDVFIWVISSGRRVAYQRIPCRELIYSVVDEECGRHCGKVQTMFLKVSKYTTNNTKFANMQLHLNVR